MTAKANTKTVPAPKKSADNEIVITRVFNAPRALVYRAWTNPVHLARWWGPRGFTNPRCEIDVRAGGVIRIDMRAPNGTVYPMAGIFLELKEPSQIVFTSGALDEKGVQLFEFLHTVDFSEKNGKTTLIIRSRVVKTTADAAKYIGGFEAGMSQSLDKLADDLVHQGEPTLNAPDDIAARSIIISRVVDAPRELVWEAMSNPKHVVHWWGPRGFSTATEIHDFRVGGEWKHVMQGPDGAKYPNYSVFQEIVKPERIVYQHSGKREDGPAISKLFTWTFEAMDGGKTKVTINMLFPTANERNFVVKEFGALEGGKQTLERLGEFLAQTKK